MALSDAQIDRFSRQIILPQIGGTGQERLLHSSVAVAGDGDLAEVVALSLAGAGIGRVALHGVEREGLRSDLVDLNPDVQVILQGGVLGSVSADVLVACDVALAELDRAAASGRPLVAGGVEEGCGWVVVAIAPDVCASCAARAFGVSELAPALSTAPTTGVIGSLMSLAVLKLRLGLDAPARRVWLRFDAAQSTLTEHPLARAADCPTCAAA